VFGNNIANTQVLTGSVTVTGSLSVVTTGTEFQVNANGVKFGNVSTDSHSITGSMNVSGAFYITASAFQIASPSTAYGGAINLINTSNNKQWNITNVGSGTGARSGNFEINNNSVDIFAISQSGNIGIGTTNPSVRLDVVAGGDAIALALRMRSQDDYSFLQFKNFAGTEVISEIYSNRTTTNVGSLIFTTNNGGVATERMRITSTGYIQQKEPAGTLVYQRIVGKKAASSSGTAVTIAYVGHTHTVTVRAYVRINDSNGGMITQVFSTAYGSSNAGTSTVAAYNQVSNVSLSYNNGAGYMIQVTPTYSGPTPDIYFTVEGISHDTITVQ
jgi:hypothetical protein